MLDIALVVHHYDRSSGTGGYVVHLAERFAREHRVTIYAAAIRAPVPDGARTVIVPALGGRSYFTILSFPVALRSVMGRHDIVHAQGWVAGHADVVTAHIVLEAWRSAARAAGIVSPTGERFLGGFVTAREASLLRRARAVITPSRRSAEEVTRLYGRGQGIHVVPHGFIPMPASPRAEARVALDLPAGATLALYVGDARKGALVALEAVARVPNLHLVVLSGTPHTDFDPWIGRLGLTSRVHWRGHRADPSLAYAAADFLVHPTIYDTFGLVVAEAMTAGLPVVVTRRAGASELLEHGVSGWLLDSPGVEETTAALHALAGDGALRQRLAAGGRAVAARRSWDQVADETLAVYRSIKPA